jgi:hypothetical protein
MGDVRPDEIKEEEAPTKPPDFPNPLPPPPWPPVIPEPAPPVEPG